METWYGGHRPVGEVCPHGSYLQGMETIHIRLIRDKGFRVGARILPTRNGNNLRTGVIYLPFLERTDPTYKEWKQDLSNHL